MIKKKANERFDIFICETKQKQTDSIFLQKKNHNKFTKTFWFTWNFYVFFLFSIRFALDLIKEDQLRNQIFLTTAKC